MGSLLVWQEGIEVVPLLRVYEDYFIEVLLLHYSHFNLQILGLIAKCFATIAAKAIRKSMLKGGECYQGSDRYSRNCDYGSQYEKTHC